MYLWAVCYYSLQLTLLQMIIIILPIGLMVRGIIYAVKACARCCKKEDEEGSLERGTLAEDESVKANLHRSYGTSQ